MRQEYPELGEQRAHVGKFYFRPPGRESWCDAPLRQAGAPVTVEPDAPAAAKP